MKLTTHPFFPSAMSAGDRLSPRRETWRVVRWSSPNALRHGNDPWDSTPSEHSPSGCLPRHHQGHLTHGVPYPSGKLLLTAEVVGLMSHQGCPSIKGVEIPGRGCSCCDVPQLDTLIRCVLVRSTRWKGLFLVCSLNIWVLFTCQPWKSWETNQMGIKYEVNSTLCPTFKCLFAGRHAKPGGFLLSQTERH